MPTRELNVVRAWSEAYERDPIAKLEGSRWFLLRGVGHARKTLLSSQLMRAVPAWYYVYFYSVSNTLFTIYFVTVVLCALRETRRNTPLLLALLATQVTFGLAWYLPCRLFHKYLHTPGSDLVLPPNYTVFRGCLIEREGAAPGDEADCPAEQRAPSKRDPQRRSESLFLSLVRRSPVGLDNFTLRHAAYEVRLYTQALVLFLSTLSGLCQQFFGDKAHFIVWVRLASNAIGAIIILDTCVSFTFGLHWSLSWALGRRVWWLFGAPTSSAPDYSGSPVFVPFDPRATCVQNIVFTSILTPASVASAVLMIEDGLLTRSAGAWVLPAASSLVLLMVLRVGAAQSWCPFSMLVGCLVAGGHLPKPKMQGCAPGETVRMLSYGIWGPVVDLADISLSTSTRPARKLSSVVPHGGAQP